MFPQTPHPHPHFIFGLNCCALLCNAVLPPEMREEVSVSLSYRRLFSVFFLNRTSHLSGYIGRQEIHRCCWMDVAAFPLLFSFISDICPKKWKFASFIDASKVQEEFLQQVQRPRQQAMDKSGNY